MANALSAFDSVRPIALPVGRRKRQVRETPAASSRQGETVHKVSPRHRPREPRDRLFQLAQVAREFLGTDSRDRSQQCVEALLATQEQGTQDQHLPSSANGMDCLQSSIWHTHRRRQLTPCCTLLSPYSPTIWLTGSQRRILATSIIWTPRTRPAIRSFIYCQACMVSPWGDRTHSVDNPVASTSDRAGAAPSNTS